MIAHQVEIPKQSKTSIGASQGIWSAERRATLRGIPRDRGLLRRGFHGLAAAALVARLIDRAHGVAILLAGFNLPVAVSRRIDQGRNLREHRALARPVYVITPEVILDI